ncbi:hypothetical protein KF728_09795 [Candidatus Obscuribacterales bacterium]|nr:hypothetical protein [Candidatus Obscuribacterales bacterium]
MQLEQEIDRAITEILSSAVNNDWKIEVLRHYNAVTINGTMVRGRPSEILSMALARMHEELEWVRENEKDIFVVVEKGREAAKARNLCA